MQLKSHWWPTYLDVMRICCPYFVYLTCEPIWKSCLKKPLNGLKFHWVHMSWLVCRDGDFCMYICREKEQKRGNNKERVCLRVCCLFPLRRSRDSYRSDGCPANKQNKTSQIWWKLSCLHISFPLPPLCLCHSVFSKNPHALGLLSLKKNTLWH